MTLDDLTVDFSHLDRETLLGDWHWLMGANRLPVMITVAGDAFVQDGETGAVYFLDTVEGGLLEVASDGEVFSALLGDRDFVMQHFAVSLVAPLLSAGKGPAPGRLLSFKQPPVLGGEYATANLEEADIEVHFSLSGQIWSQVSQLPEGTPISSIELR
ncbi:MAG: DUF1851 domain-containing protein [Verrucomicrobiaceae bacterium]|nr:MAG: DUF1851 domain-containing protein [Verrucomicrobiaceae bacterium]